MLQATRTSAISCRFAFAALFMATTFAMSQIVRAIFEAKSLIKLTIRTTKRQFYLLLSLLSLQYNYYALWDKLTCTTFKIRRIIILRKRSKVDDTQWYTVSENEPYGSIYACTWLTESELNLPMKPYERNLLTDPRAMPVIGPVVSSDRITSRNGPRTSLGANSLRSEATIQTLTISFLQMVYFTQQCRRTIIAVAPDMFKVFCL